MRNVYFYLFVFCSVRLFSLSSDDFIIQQSIDMGNVRHRPKIYLGQTWDELNIKDKLINTEKYEQWGLYKDVVIYFYENIEIVTAQYIPNAMYRTIVQITITGNKYFTMNEITIYDLVSHMISIYGKPKIEQSYESMVYSLYELDNPRSDYIDLQSLHLNFISLNGIIQKIRVSYAYSI